jgi:hypothetical protein
LTEAASSKIRKNATSSKCQSLVATPNFHSKPSQYDRTASPQQNGICPLNSGIAILPSQQVLPPFTPQITIRELQRMAFSTRSLL